MKLNAGASVEVLSHNNGWVQLRSGTLEGYAQVQPLRRSCHAAVSGHQTDMLADLPIEPIVGSGTQTTPFAAPGQPATTAATAANGTTPGTAAGPGMAVGSADMAASGGQAADAPPSTATAAAPSPMILAPAPTAVAAMEPPLQATQAAPTMAPTAEAPEQVSMQVPAPNHHVAYAATLWTAAGVGLVGAGGMFGYNTVRANTLENDIHAYNNQNVRSQTTATNLQQRVSQIKSMDTWTIIAASAGAACAAGAIYFTWFADDTSSSGAANAGSGSSGKRQVGINVLPGGISIFGSF